MTAPRTFLDDLDDAHQRQISGLVGLPMTAPDATATAIPAVARDADVKRRLAQLLNAKAAADSTRIVNKPRTGSIYDDFGPDWVAGGGRFVPRDKANEAESAASAAEEKAGKTVPPAMRKR